MANMALEKVTMPEQDPKVRARNFEEVTLGYTKEMAMEEASRCLNCKHKPCVSGCPVGVRIPEFIAEVAKGDFEKHTKLSHLQIPFLPYADEYALRKINAKANA